MPETHPLNRDFRWKPAPSPPYRRITEEQARSYDRLGFTVVEDAFDAETIARVVEEIDPYEAQGAEYLRAKHGGKLFIARADEITFTVHLVVRSALLRKFVSGPVFRDLAHDLIGPNVRLYWDQAVYKKPGNHEEFPWHQDNGYTFVEPQQYLTCWVALTDATLENGCPWVAPGVHTRGTLRHELTDTGYSCLKRVDDAIPTPVRAGSIVVFSSLTPHRTGPNSGDDVRKTYIVQIAADGAEVMEPGSERSPRFAACDAPDRQFLILKDGLAPGPPGEDGC